MKPIIRISAAGLTLLVLSYMVIKAGYQHDDAENKITNENPSSSKSSGRNETRNDSQNTVKFSQFAPSRFTQVKEYSLMELAEKYHFPVEITDKKSKYFIYSNDAGNVIKITKHAGHYQSVSKRNDVESELKKYGYQITQLGSDFFNLKNRDGMYIIIDALRGSTALEDVDFGGNYRFRNYDEKTEAELIPVKFVLKNPDVDLPINIEMEGILINKKQDFINAEWQTDTKFRGTNLDDYIASYWKLFPVHLAEIPDKDLKYSPYILNERNRVGLFLPELRVSKGN